MRRGIIEKAASSEMLLTRDDPPFYEYSMFWTALKFYSRVSKWFEVEQPKLNNYVHEINS